MYPGADTFVLIRPAQTFYERINLAFLALLSALVISWTGLTRAHLGLSRGGLRRSAAIGLAIGALVPTPVFLLVAFPGLLGEGNTDPRLAGIGLAEFLYQATVRIPLGTALFEEMLFRGLLYGSLLKVSGHRAAILGSSALFGLWHVRPTHELLSETEAFSGNLLLGLAITGGVLATFAGGLLFAWLRYKTGHVIGGVLAHGLINSLSATAVFLRG